MKGTRLLRDLCGGSDGSGAGTGVGGQGTGFLTFGLCKVSKGMKTSKSSHDDS